jgi:hypothetical protein
MPMLEGGETAAGKRSWKVSTSLSLCHEEERRQSFEDERASPTPHMVDVFLVNAADETKEIERCLLENGGWIRH